MMIIKLLGDSSISQHSELYTSTRCSLVLFGDNHTLAPVRGEDTFNMSCHSLTLVARDERG